MNRLCLCAVALSVVTVSNAPPIVAQTQTLDTIRVAARTADPALALTRSTEVVDRDELRRRAGDNLADILRTSLGVDVTPRSPAQADVSIRGSSFNQIVILVDGVRVSDVQSGHYNLDLAVPVESIERIEILRGGGSTLYGADAIGGVVNIVTRRGADVATVGAQGGTFGTAGFDLGAGAGRGNATLRLTTDARRSDGHRDGTDYRAVQTRLAGATPLGGGALSMDAGLGVRDFGAADFYGAYPSYEDTRTATAAARYDRAIPGDLRLNASVDARRHYDLYTLVRTNPATYQNRHISWQRGGRAVITGHVQRANAAVGVEGLEASLESARLGDHVEQRRAAFTEVSMGSGAHTLGMIGGRFDWSSRTGSFFSPGASLATALTPSFRLRASANRGYRAPSWTEAYYSDPANVANPDLRAETFDMAEVGATATPPWATMDLALFTRRGTSLIDWTKPTSSPSSPWRSTNLEAATMRGAEIDASITRLPGIDWRLRASGLRIISADADTLVGKYALSPLTETASLEASTHSIFGVQFTANSGRFRRAREREYWRTDFRATRALGQWTVRLDALNVTDAHYRDASAMPSAGRILLIGVTHGRAGVR